MKIILRHKILKVFTFSIVLRLSTSAIYRPTFFRT